MTDLEIPFKKSASLATVRQKLGKLLRYPDPRHVRLSLDAQRRSEGQLLRWEACAPNTLFVSQAAPEFKKLNRQGDEVPLKTPGNHPADVRMFCDALAQDEFFFACGSVLNPRNSFLNSSAHCSATLFCLFSVAERQLSDC